MRFHQILQQLNEVRMASSNLKQFVNSPEAQGMQAGFEAELVFTGLGDGEEYEPDWEPDYDQDERAHSIENIIDFFQSGDFADLSNAAANRIREQMQNDYMEWLDEKMRDDWDEDRDDYVYKWIKNNEAVEDLSNDEIQELRDQAVEEQNDSYQSAMEEYYDDWRDSTSLDESDWLRDTGIRNMSDAQNTYDMMWPHYHDTNEGYGGNGEFNVENARRLADSLSETLGVETTVSSGYHSAHRDTETWIFEPDGSLDADDNDNMPVEIVSPPMPLSETLAILPKFFEWAEDNGAYANDSTGFHMSVSMPEHKGDKLDFVKLALFLGDEHVLDQFGRSSNTYAKSAISKIRHQASNKLTEATETKAEAVLKKMRNHLDQLASQALASPSGFGKYTSINPKKNYVEFRSAGGSNYFEDMDKIQDTLMRYARAMSIAMNPDAYKQEYARKLYKLLTKTETEQVTDPKTGRTRTQAKAPVDSDAISLFSRYVAGELPKSALKSFLKLMQHNRDIDRGKTTGKLPLDYEPDGDYVIRGKDENKQPYGPIIHRFNATGSSDAIQKALEWGKKYGLEKSDMSLMHVDNVPRSILDAVPQPPVASQEPTRWRVYHPNGVSSSIFTAVTSTEAIQKAKEEWGERTNPDDVYRAEPYEESDTQDDDDMTEYVLRRREGVGGTGPILHRFRAGSATDAIQQARQWAEDNNIPRVEIWLDEASRVPPEVLNAAPEVPLDVAQNFSSIETEPQNFPAARQPGNEFTGQWEIRDMDTDEVLHTFGGIGNSQADANRHASHWLATNGPEDAYGTEIGVYPVMR